MISRGRIRKHEEEDPTAFITHDKNKKKGKGGPSNSRNPPPQNSNRRKELFHIEFYNCHKKDHYSRYFPEKNNGPHYNTISNKNRFNDKRRIYDQNNDHNGRDEIRISNSPNDNEYNHCRKKKSIFPRYESNVVNQSEYIVIYALTS